MTTRRQNINGQKQNDLISMEINHKEMEKTNRLTQSYHEVIHHDHKEAQNKQTENKSRC